MRPEPHAAARRMPATNRAPNRAGVRCAGCRHLSLVDEKRATARIRSQVDLADRNFAQSSSIQLIPVFKYMKIAYMKINSHRGHREHREINNSLIALCVLCVLCGYSSTDPMPRRQPGFYFTFHSWIPADQFCCIVTSSRSPVVATGLKVS